MAIQSFQLDPNCASQSVFASHRHKYRKVTQIGVDVAADWSSPVLVNIVPNATTHAAEADRIRAAGVTIRTRRTTVPK